VKKRGKIKKWKSKDIEKGLMQVGKIEKKGTRNEWGE